MSLRNPIQEDATLPDGRVVHIRVGVPEDSYVPARQRGTVAVEARDPYAPEGAIAQCLTHARVASASFIN